MSLPHRQRWTDYFYGVNVLLLFLVLWHLNFNSSNFRIVIPFATQSDRRFLCFCSIAIRVSTWLPVLWTVFSWMSHVRPKIKAQFYMLLWDLGKTGESQMSYLHFLSSTLLRPKKTEKKKIPMPNNFIIMETWHSFCLSLSSRFRVSSGLQNYSNKPVSSSHRKRVTPFLWHCKSAFHSPCLFSLDPPATPVWPCVPCCVLLAQAGSKCD